MRIAKLCVMLGVTGFVVACNSVKMTNPQAVTGFQQTDLVADVAGAAQHIDPRLVNSWGLAFVPGQDFWIADNSIGTARVFDVSGTPRIPLSIDIPLASGGRPPSRPTGVQFNPVAQDFMVRSAPAQLLFASEDGTVSTWATINGNIPTAAVLAVDDSSRGAIYTGLAIVNPACCREYLAVADFHNGFIATYDVSFSPLSTLGSFKDSSLPDGFAPFNIQQIGGQVFVTYALQDAAGTNPVVGAGNGIVDVFDQEGNFIRRFASNAPLNAPWGIVQASTNFGKFSNDILIGNFGDGAINAFDPTTGSLIGQVTDSNGRVTINQGLWGMTFRNDGVGSPDTLYFTAGAKGEDHGLLGAISPLN